VSKERIYLCIARRESGEKLAEYVVARAPNVGEIIRISYLDAQGKFEVLEVTPKALTQDYQVVLLIVRPVEPDDKPPEGWVSLASQLLSRLFNEKEGRSRRGVAMETSTSNNDVNSLG